MRTEAEVRKALDALRWYVNGPDGKGGRVRRQDRDTMMNVVGVLVALEWMAATGDGSDLVTSTLRNIAVMRQGPERN